MINSWREVDAAINKLIQKVEDLYRQVTYTNSSQIGNQTTVDGDATFNGLVTIRAPKILCLTSGNEPTDSDASGVFMSAAGETFGEDTYNIGGVENGGLQFGIRSTDGVGVFSGGDATIGADGIVIDRMGYLMSHTATDGTTERTGSMGMWSVPGGTAPCYGFSLNAPADETELVTNGDAETGDTTGWNETTETNGAWSAFSSPSVAVIAGTYSFMWNPSNATNTGVLDQSVSVSASTGYRFTIKHSKLHADGSHKCELKWYDSGASLLSTGTIFNLSAAYYPTTSTFNLTSPSGAASVSIVITCTNMNKDSGLGIYDSISLKAVSVASNLYFDSTGELNLNDNPILPKHCYISGLTVASNATLTLVTSGGTSYNYVHADDAANGDTYTYQVPPLAAGTYTVYFCGAKASGGGKVDWTLDGTSVVTGQDWYGSAAPDYVYTVTGVSVSSGAHTLLGTINGKNASSSDYVLRIYSIVFVKTA